MRRRAAIWPATAVVVVAVAGVLIGLRLAAPAAPGFALVPGAGNPTSAHAAEVTLRAELTAQNLRYTGVTCIANGRAYAGHPIIRCNVDFGDPHIEAYCTVVESGRLITNHQDRAIPCGPDLAGSKPILLP